MKKFLAFALLAAFVLSAAAASAATTLKTSGAMDFSYGWTDNTNFFDGEDDRGQEDDLMAMQRLRAYFDWSASENLRGVFGIEYGAAIWGNQATGADLDGDERAIEVKHAYMDFTVPNTGLSLRMGLQPIALPANFGSPIFDYDVAGILAQYKFNDMVSGAFGWFRLGNQNTGTSEIGGSSGNKNDEVDAFALMLPITADGVEFTPWAMYAVHGQNASGGAPLAAGLAPANATAPIGNDLDVWWVGGQFKMTMFAPFTIYSDLIYGNQDGSNNSRNDREGWYFDAGVDYKMDGVTPGLFFMYTTGDDDDPTNGSERIPTVGANVFFTSFGFAGAAGLLDDYADRVISSDGTEGMWLLCAQLADFSFLNKLSHTFRVAYGEGTNDADVVKVKGIAERLTDKDSFWEVNLDSTYSIYENLTAVIEMGYINLDLDSATWDRSNTGVWAARADKTSDAWKLAINLNYKF
jgi:hypothetical protein